MKNFFKSRDSRINFYVFSLFCGVLFFNSYWYVFVLFVIIAFIFESKNDVTSKKENLNNDKANLSKLNKTDKRILDLIDFHRSDKATNIDPNLTWESLPESNFGRSKPKKIKSKIKWKLNDVINFGEKVREEYYDLPTFNGFGIKESVAGKKRLKLAGDLENDLVFKKYLGEEFTKDIKNFDRVRDFYKFEMFDDDPIWTAIQNEDKERILFYSFLEIPKKIFLNVEWEDEIHIEEPVKRAPYFAIAKCHMAIILQVLEHLKIYDDNEISIKWWIINQITDPLDKDNLADKIISRAVEDDRFRKEIWSGLYRLLEMNFLSPEGLINKVEDVIEIADSLFSQVLSNYFLNDPEDAYSLIKPLNESLDS